MQGLLQEILAKHELLSEERIEELWAAANEKGLSPMDVVLNHRAIDEEKLVRAFAAELDLPFAEKIDIETIPEALVELVPINFARQHQILPVARGNGATPSALVAIANPFNAHALDDIRLLLGMRVEPVAATSEAIDDAINTVYERRDETALAEAEEGEEAEELQDIIDTTDEAPVIRWVNNLFWTSVKQRASDIHIEPTDDKVVVRYRIDGKLYQRKEANRAYLPSIVSRIKIEAGLDIAEKRLPQDGRISKKIAGKVVDVRVSTIPTAKGERVVMRLLDKQNVMLDLIDLGFARRQLDTFEELIERPNGIILVTGPTGSGKTTTLYGALNRINRPEKNILTAEDPVEYELPGIGQVHVKPKIGLNFASALRSFLRQDPDVIMVGEIRDHETAEIAIHASLTGHLVLSTLHTNDAPSSIGRLVEMGVKPYQISNSVLAILAQRLVRRLCDDCKQPYQASEADLLALDIDVSHVNEAMAELRKEAASTVLRDSYPDSPLDVETTNVVVPSAQPGGLPTFFRPGGCDACSHTGYRGRVGIYELMVIDENIRREIARDSDAKVMQRVARANGMKVLREDGARQVVAGITSVDEVLAATQAGESSEAAE